MVGLSSTLFLSHISVRGNIGAACRRLFTAKMAGKYKIVMVRHGESEWNLKNQFCGWFDSDLSENGKICNSYEMNAA